MAQTDRETRRFNRRFAHWLKTHTVHWAVGVVIANAAIIGLTIYVFPKTTLTLTIAILASMFLSSISDLSGVITDASQDDKIEDLSDDGEANDSN